MWKTHRKFYLEDPSCLLRDVDFVLLCFVFSLPVFDVVLSFHSDFGSLSDIRLVKVSAIDSRCLCRDATHALFTASTLEFVNLVFDIVQLNQESFLCIIEGSLLFEGGAALCHNILLLFFCLLQGRFKFTENRSCMTLPTSLAPSNPARAAGKSSLASSIRLATFCFALRRSVWSRGSSAYYHSIGENKSQKLYEEWKWDSIHSCVRYSA